MNQGDKILVTGAGGLIGSAVVQYYLRQGYENINGVDNNSRSEFFGPKGDTTKAIEALGTRTQFRNFNIDIANRISVRELFVKHGPFKLVVHTAAQPSHDLAAKIPFRDWDVNANGTFNLLEATRQFSPEAVFVFTSTNKVYGDNPNLVPLVEKGKRFDFDLSKQSRGITSEGVTEDMSLDNTTHSLFGVSKAAADLAVQEYGKYFGLKTGVFRGGCLTGPQHAAVELHGFLSYIVGCAVNGSPYTIFGYKGKQVRDQIHSADVARAIDAFAQNPRAGEVYNLGGGRQNAVSMIETIEMLERDFGRKLKWTYDEKNRVGDHICYYTDMSKFKRDYPGWKMMKGLTEIVAEIVEEKERKRQE
jgi:CDP-paratose 2-epimerase